MSKNRLTGLAGALALGTGLALNSPAGAQRLSENDMFNAKTFGTSAANELGTCAYRIMEAGTITIRREEDEQKNENYRLQVQQGVPYFNIMLQASRELAEVNSKIRESGTNQEREARIESIVTGIPEISWDKVTGFLENIVYQDSQLEVCHRGVRDFRMVYNITQDFR